MLAGARAHFHYMTACGETRLEHCQEGIAITLAGGGVGLVDHAGIRAQIPNAAERTNNSCGSGDHMSIQRRAGAPTMTRYYIRVDDLAQARGSDPTFAWTGKSPQDLAQTLERALREPDLMLRWRDAQDEPEDVSPVWLAVDPEARVGIEDRAHHVEMLITTKLLQRLWAQRLDLLIGAHWTLGDVQ
jgi:hypothetical protein